MKTITFDELIELNRMLEEKNLKVKVHLRDACAGQAFWIENLDNISIPLEVYTELESFFNKKNISIAFNNSKTEFWSKNLKI